MTVSLSPDNRITYMENLRASPDKLLEDKNSARLLNIEQYIKLNCGETIACQNIKHNL